MRAKPLVLVVEDDPRTMEIVIFALTNAGYDVLPAGDGELGLDLALRQQPDMALLDIMLPGMDGLELCSRLREHALEIPVLMLTALGQDDDVVRGLERGADDYLSKPFSLKVLVARVGALMRRQEQAPSRSVITLGQLTIDLAGHIVLREGEQVHLTPIEFRILEILARRPGQVATFRQLLREAAGYDGGDQEAQDIIKVHISHLRRKLEPDSRGTALIVNARGIGYKLVPPLA
ncbi:MAG: response regulator transcription factor [Chloroflexota bacterium]